MSQTEGALQVSWCVSATPKNVQQSLTTALLKLDTSWTLVMTRQGKQTTVKATQRPESKSVASQCCECKEKASAEMDVKSPRDGTVFTIKVCSDCKSRAREWMCDIRGCTNKDWSFGGPPDSFSQVNFMFGGQSGVPVFVCWKCFVQCLTESV